MRAEINLGLTELAEVSQQLAPVLHRRIVRFVCAKEAPDGFQLAEWLRGVYFDSDGEGFGLCGMGSHGVPRPEPGKHVTATLEEGEHAASV